MSTNYPVLDNRPINKWKVAELREELKRRNLTTKGLKDDLVRRLDEAIRKEREAAEIEENKRLHHGTDTAIGLEDTQPDTDPIKLVHDVQKSHHGEVTNVDGHVDRASTKNCVEIEHCKVSDEVATGSTGAAAGERKDLEAPVGSMSVENEIASADQAIDVKIDKETEVIDSSQDKDVVVEVSGVWDGSIQRSTAGQDDVDVNISSSEGVLGDNFKRQEGDVEVTPVASNEALKNNIKLENEGLKLQQMDAQFDVVDVKISSSDRVLEDDFKRQEGDVEVTPVACNEALENNIKLENESLKLQQMDAQSDVVDVKISSSDGVLEDRFKRQEDDVDVTAVASNEALGNNNIKLEIEGLKLPQMDAESDVCHPTQVYEVNPNLGSQVKSDSFSTDTLPINENKDLNDNLNADNVKLEPEVFRQVMELQSSSKDLLDVGSSRPLDDQMPHEVQGLVGETEDNKSSDVKFSMKNDNADQISVDGTDIEHGLESRASNNSEETDVQFEKARTLGDVVEPNSSPNKMVASAEEIHEMAAFNDDRKDISKIADVVDGESMEKINLDQSSADDSMEEDVEPKHVDSDYSSKKESDKTEEPIMGTEEPKVQPSGTADEMRHDIPSERIESPKETKDKLPDLSEKRKFQDEVGDGSKEPTKRQRRWNTDSLKTSEPQNSSIALPKNLAQTTPVKPILGSTNSAPVVDAPKERFVPKSSKTATTSLKIENFLRPFTLKAVQELLAKTGEVCSFWMDHIKTHCYVTYSSVEEAIETRNAVYNLQWPQNGGRFLVANFVDPQEVKSKIDGSPQSATPPKSTTTAVPPATPSVQTPPAGQQGCKEQVDSGHSHTRQLPAPSAPPTRERLPSPVAGKVDPPIVTLDDLFRKTKATPRIYYLPLTDEEVAKKLAPRGNSKR